MNGIEAMQSVLPRVLKVKTGQSESGRVYVSIEDTGTGIDPANLERILAHCLPPRNAEWEWDFPYVIR